jgi:hypothetical protein
MNLLRVVYELIDSEADPVGRGPVSDCDELWRQVRLEGADGVRLYISWNWGRGQPDYFVDYGSASFFNVPPEAERDVSDTPLWRPLIGQAVIVRHRDRSLQVIEVRSGAAVVYCCSFQCDRVYVMQKVRVPHVAR